MTTLKIKLIKRDISAHYSSIDTSIKFTDTRGEFPDFFAQVPQFNGDNAQEIYNEMNKKINDLRP